MNNCLKPSLERLTAREWKIRTEFFLPFPTVYFIVSSPIKNLYRTLKIILKVWNFLWRSLDIDPDIYVMFLSLLHWNKTVVSPLSWRLWSSYHIKICDLWLWTSTSKVKLKVKDKTWTSFFSNMFIFQRNLRTNLCIGLDLRKVRFKRRRQPLMKLEQLVN